MHRIGIVGAGRAGTVIGAALRAAGHQVIGVTARSAPSRERAAQLLPGVAVLEAPDLAAQAEVLVLAVPDDAIASVAAGLGAQDGQYVVHLSGAHGLAVLDGIAGTPVALHPPMTFTGTPLDLERLPVVTFTATAAEAARPFVAELVKGVGAGVQWVADEHRAAYHAGLVQGANYLVTLVEQASAVLRSAGIADPVATLRPLMTALLDNALRDGMDALTGPISRGDAETVRAHLLVLSDDVRPVYVALARATVDLAQNAGTLDAGTADTLRLLLGESSDGPAKGGER
jgi:predicted short-subunit dehydrogenase-like oxidoreductase (DUF2520 family)